ELVGHAAVVALLAVAVGEVAVHDPQASEAEELEAPLDVEVRLPQARALLVEGGPRVEAHAGVALALGSDEVRVPADGGVDLGRELLGEGADLLHPDHVGPTATEPVEEALAMGRAQPVHIPGDDF